MAFFNWNDNLNIGILQIDAQHKNLVNIVNQLYEAMSKGQGKEIKGKIVKEMAGYTITHFGAEEKLMQQHNYPEFAQHKKEHELFIKKVQEFNNEIQKGNMIIVSNVANFLKEWLIKHIQGTDKKYAPFLKEKGVK